MVEKKQVSKTRNVVLCFLFLLSIYLKNVNGLTKNKNTNTDILSATENPNENLAYKTSQYDKINETIDVNEVKNNENYDQLYQNYLYENNSEQTMPEKDTLSVSEIEIDSQILSTQQEKPTSLTNPKNIDDIVQEDETIEDLQEQIITPLVVLPKHNDNHVSQKMKKMMNIMQNHSKGISEQYNNYYSKLTNHLNSQKGVFIAVLGTIIGLTIVFLIAKRLRSDDFPFLNRLNILNGYKQITCDEYTSPSDEAFYTDCNIMNVNSLCHSSTSNSKILQNSAYLVDSYLTDSDFKLQNEWLRDRTESYSQNEGNPFFVNSKRWLLQQQPHNTYKDNMSKGKSMMDDTLDMYEANFQIKDLLDSEEHQSLNNSQNQGIYIIDGQDELAVSIL